MNRLQKLRVGAALSAAFLRLVRDPLADLTPIFKIVDGVSDPEYIASIAASFHAPHALDALETQHRLGDVDLDALRALPDGTFGREFARFLDAHDLDIAALPITDPSDRGGYIAAHLYETHDIWHVITGFEPDVAGELGVQAVYLAMFPAKLPLMIFPAALLNALIYDYGDTRRRMNALTRGWLLGRRAKQLFGVRWRDHWEVPLPELRERLGIRIAEVEALVPDEQPAALVA